MSNRRKNIPSSLTDEDLRVVDRLNQREDVTVTCESTKLATGKRGEELKAPFIAFGRRSLVLLIFLFVSSVFMDALWSAPLAAAQESISESSQVLIKVLAIEGLARGGTAQNVGTANADPVQFANRRSSLALKGISPKLASLPFDTFSLLAEERFIVPLKKRMQFSLAAGHHITIRPISFDDKRVCFWLKWQESNGIDVVDTRLTVNLGEVMVTAWEQSPNSGFVLAVEVDVSKAKRKEG